MSYRELVDGYKAKLKTANERIFELEGIVAEKVFELEKLQAQCESQVDAQCLARAQARMAELEKAIVDHDTCFQETLACISGSGTGSYYDEVEKLRQSNGELMAKLGGQETDNADETLCLDTEHGQPGGDSTATLGDETAVASTLRDQVDMLQGHVASLEEQLENVRSGDPDSATSQSPTVLTKQVEDLQRQLEISKAASTSIEKQLQSANASNNRDAAPLLKQIQDLTNQLETYKTSEASLRAQLAQSGGKDAADAVYIEALKSQIQNHTAAQSSLQITANNYKVAAEKAQMKQQRAVNKLEDKEKVVQRLKGWLEREKEARYISSVKLWDSRRQWSTNDA